MKRILAAVILAMFAISAGCGGSGDGPAAGGGGGSSSTEVGSAVVTANFNMLASQQQSPLVSAKAAAMAPSFAPMMALMTHYDLLSALTNTVVGMDVMFTSTTSTASYGLGTNIVGGTGTVTVPNIRIGSYNLTVNGISAGGSVLFTKTQPVTITTGPNNITIVLDVSPSFPVTFTIAGMPAGTTGLYPVVVSQLLSNGSTTTSTVAGSYDSVTGNLVFTPSVALWPNPAISLSYAIPTFGTALIPDPLTIDVLALIASNHAGTAAYQALVPVDVGVVGPTLGGLGMDLVTTAGQVLSGPGGGSATRVAGTGIVTIVASGFPTDVTLTTMFNAVAGQATPMTYQCSGYAGTFDVGLIQAVSPWAEYLTVPVTVTCGAATPITINITPTATDAHATLQLRLGAAPAGTVFTITNWSL